MKALVATGLRDRPVEIRSVDDVDPAGNQTVVKVEALSLNRGEYHRLKEAADGWRPGWDFAGVVEQAASDGTGPALGDRVVGLVEGAGWAEFVAADSHNVCVVPESIDLGVAATLPVAGITALRTLQAGGNLLGKDVLVTGAAGGVGVFATTMASRAGANVTAVIGQGRHDLPEDDNTTVVRAISDAKGSYDLILESVGGDSLATALRQVSPGGTVVTFGNSSQSLTSLNISDFYPSHGAQLRGYYLFCDIAENPIAGDLHKLLQFTARGILDPRVGTSAHWTDAVDVLAALADRKIAGKAVLTI